MLNSKPDSHSTAYTPTSPAERYAQALESGQFMPDEAQAQAVQELDRVWKELLTRYKASKKHFDVSADKHTQKVFICGEVLVVVRHG
jgi:cell division protein ZapE